MRHVFHCRLALGAVVLAVMVSGCAPSLQYRIGEGFYSKDLSEAEVQAAANQGRVEKLGTFSEEIGDCFNYQQGSTDRNIVIPAVKRGLEKSQGNVATKITANEKWYDFLLGLFIIPAYMGCSNWEVSGNILKVEPVTTN